jgi:hypothetical protein
MVEHWRALESELGAKIIQPADWIRDHPSKQQRDHGDE